MTDRNSKLLPATFFDVLMRKEMLGIYGIENDAETITSMGVSSPIQDPSFLKNYKNIEEKRLERIAMPSCSVQEREYLMRIGTIGRKIYTDILNFLLYGKKVFYITDNLADHLMNTKLNADSSFLAPPFPCCMLVFTSARVIDALYESANQFASNGGQRDYSKPVSVFMTEILSMEGIRSIFFNSYHPGEMNLKFLMEDAIEINPDMTVSDYLSMSRPHLVGKRVEDARKVFESVDENSAEASMPFMRTVLNAILYLVSNNPDILSVLSPASHLINDKQRKKSSVKQRKIGKKIDRLSSCDYILVGGKIPPLVKEISSLSGERRKLAVRFIVKGHYRYVVHGERRAQRRLQWIKPFYKGPEMAEIINKPYIVQ